MTKEFKIEDLIEKIDKIKKDNSYDLSTEEDLALAIMNLISIEEHLFFTGVKTEKDEYFDFLTQVREVRKNLLAKMIEKTEGETWCICKHLLSATMRMIEVGTKLLSDNKKSEAKEIFKNAHATFSMFWAIRLKLIELPENKIISEDRPMTLNQIMDKLVDCCKE
jgi:hypothetical protein